MADKRKWTLFISAMMAVGLANYGCGDEDAVFLPEGDPSAAADECKNANSCSTAEACQSGVGAIACKCVSDADYCHSDARCNGVGSCKYECSKNAGTCGYAGCASDPACQSGPGPGPGPQPTCDVSTLAAADDFDNDGITNGKELTSRIEVNGETKSLDPCKLDTDGDGISDGDEDLNHNGIYEPWLGETNPVDINDPEDADTEAGKSKIAVKKLVCNADNLRDSILLRSYRVAKIRNDIQYLSDINNTTSDVTAFDDPSTKVVGAFIGLSESFDAVNFIHYAFHDYTDSSNPVASERVLSNANDFNSTDNFIPNSVWLNNNIYARLTPSSQLDFERFQVVPDHVVNRHIFTLTLAEGVKLSDVRDEIVANITEGESKVQSASAFGDCADNKAKLYLAQSRYYENASDRDPIFIYSIALACNGDMASIATENMMNDVKSGTLVAGDTKFYSNRDFLCQQEKYGDAAGSVDFLWVVDNSGSMADELDNLSKTIDMFNEKLENSGIDFHIGVTTTDSYTIDEWPDGYKAYESVYVEGGKGKSLSYLEPTGLINGSGQVDNGVKCMFFEGDSTEHFKTRMLSRGCTKNGVTRKNICGYGLEDGIKSGVETLRRLATTSGGDNGYEQKVQFACGSTDVSECANINRCILRDEALKYIIFVSDEESRQFKESVGVSANVYATFENHKGSELKICKTGYKLSVEDGQDSQNILEIVYNMAMGVPNGLDDSSASTICNPEMKTTTLISRESNAISESSTAEELKAAAPEYYNMLMYYIQQYNQFAGKGGIAAFAIVGDIGVEKNGTCEVLDDSNAGATEGANYGLSYIHLAKFLGALDANGQFTGKTGASGCICNTEYTTTVNQIFEDVQGRVASHPLRGYPISATIRVAVAKSDGSIKELERGASMNGWRYDESQNAITFNGLTGVEGSDEIAISYVIWSRDEG